MNQFSGDDVVGLVCGVILLAFWTWGCRVFISNYREWKEKTEEALKKNDPRFQSGKAFRRSIRKQRQRW